MLAGLTTSSTPETLNGAGMGDGVAELVTVGAGLVAVGVGLVAVGTGLVVVSAGLVAVGVGLELPPPHDTILKTTRQVKTVHRKANLAVCTRFLCFNMIALHLFRYHCTSTNAY